MDYDVFVKKVKDAKPGYSHLQDIKVVSNQKHTVLKIYRDIHCRHCNHSSNEVVIVQFKEPHHLTVFETGLLFSLFYHNRRPIDYASFHKCVAGKRFIENIVNVEVVWNDVQ